MNLQATPRYSVEQAVQRWKTLAKVLCEGDEDLFQELMVEICYTAETFEHLTGKFVQMRLHRACLMYWRGAGKSIDNGAKTRRKNTIRCPNDVYEMDDDIVPDTLALGRSISWVSNPETTALFSISQDTILQQLSPEERAFLLALCEGRTGREIAKFGINQKKHPAIKAKIRKLYLKYFNVGERESSGAQIEDGTFDG